MNKLQNWALGVIVLFMVLLTSCADQLETRTTHLTSGTWQFQSLSNPDLDSDTRDFFTAFISAFEVTYMEDGTYLLAPAVPDSSIQDAMGTWSFNDDATQIIMDEGTDDEITADVVDLSEQLFIYSYTDSLGTTELTYIQ